MLRKRSFEGANRCLVSAEYQLELAIFDQEAVSGIDRRAVGGGSVPQIASVGLVRLR